MSENKAKLNLHQKLIEIRKAVPFLKKENNGYQFKYVSSSQTLGAVRNAMDEHHVFLEARVLGREIHNHETKNGGHAYFTILDMEFTWVDADNPADKITCRWVGQGLDDGEKGVGKAVTYAEKYFILKTFNVPTDKDDPDSDQGQPPRTASRSATPTCARNTAGQPVSKEEQALKKKLVEKMKAEGVKIKEEQVAFFTFVVDEHGKTLDYFLNNYQKCFDAWVKYNDEKAAA